MSLVANTHLAHRLTEYAAEVKPAAQLPLAMDLFADNHFHGVSPTDRDALAALGVKHGLFPDAPAARAWLAGTGSDAAVRAAYAAARRRGVSGVPFFLFQDKYPASGAAGVDEFSRILAQVARAEGFPAAGADRAGAGAGAGTACKA